MDLAKALSTVKQLELKLVKQAHKGARLQDYYDGIQPLRFASSEWQQYFAAQYSGFADNWCAPVVDAKVERLRKTGTRPFGETSPDQDLRRVWAVNSLDADSRLAFTEAAITGRAFALVWPNDDDQSTPIVTFESPIECVVAYAPGSRRIRTAGMKLWQEDDGTAVAYLYTPDELWKFIRVPLSSEAADEAVTPEWELDTRDEDGNPPWVEHKLGVVPLVELQNRPRLARDPASDIHGTAMMQDAINLLWAHLFTASDFAALPQRVVLGAQLPKIPVLDDKGEKIGEKPVGLSEANIKRIMNLEGPDAKIASWPAADLDPFLKVISQAVGHVASQTRTPAYYFITGGTIANISADAIKALDAGLVQRTRDAGEFLGEGLNEIDRLVCLAQNNETKAKAVSAGKTMWADMEVRSEAQRADASQKYRAIGFPFEWIAKRHIDDPDELKQVLAQHQAEQDDLLSLGIKPTLSAEPQPPQNQPIE